MKLQQHNIGKMALDITFGSEKEADRLQQRFFGDTEEKLKQSIEETFDQVLPDDDVVVIEKIELDIGTISQEEWLDGLRTRIKHELTQVLHSRMHSPNMAEIRTFPRQSVWSEILIIYLQTGSFPWWVEQIALKQLEKEVLKETASGNETLQKTYMEAFKNKSALSRLAAQFTIGFKKKLFFHLFPARAKFISETVKLFGEFFGQKIQSFKKAHKSWPDWIWQLMQLGIRDDVFKQQFTTRFFLQVCETYHLKPKNIARELPETLHSFLAKDLKPDQPETTAPEEVTEVNDKPERKEWIISNAGLVILWPFLQQLFSNLRLIDASLFLSENQRERAIYCLQYLVYGTTGAEEHQLLLNKMLTGWPIEQPLTKKIRLKAKETKMLNDFLKEIILHWSALRNSSVTALRETFLQRSGIARAGNRHAHLKVERKGTDILRDQLPWAINVIKLPWMDKILYVEW